MQGKLGGGEGVEGFYGSLNQNSMTAILGSLVSNTGMGAESVFLDVGAGIGRPMLHALLTGRCSHAYGIELDKVKCDKADAFFKLVVGTLCDNGETPNDGWLI